MQTAITNITAHIHGIKTEEWKHPRDTPLRSNSRHQHKKWPPRTQLTVNGCVKNAWPADPYWPVARYAAHHVVLPATSKHIFSTKETIKAHKIYVLHGRREISWHLGIWSELWWFCLICILCAGLVEHFKFPLRLAGK
jgi:hypothetical protein